MVEAMKGNLGGRGKIVPVPANPYEVAKKTNREHLKEFLGYLYPAGLPPKIEETLLKYADSIYKEYVQRAEKRIRELEKGGVLLSNAEKERVRGQEYGNVVLERMDALGRKQAEWRVRNALDSVGKKIGKDEMEAWIKFTQRYLTLHPWELAEAPAPPTKNEKEAHALQIMENMLAEMYGRSIPEKIAKELRKKAQQINDFAATRANMLYEYRKAMGAGITEGDRVRIWQFEYKKAILDTVANIVRPEAERRVDNVLSTLPESAAEQRDGWVRMVQYNLALKPWLLEMQPPPASRAFAIRPL